MITPTRSSHSRRGHTLFELLLALGLSLVLLVAVYSALDLHWKYSAAGKEEMERMQLARAVLEKVALDIRHVAYRDSDEAIGLVGTADRLVLQINKRSLNQIWASANPNPTQAATTQGVRFVSWSITDHGRSNLIEVSRTTDGLVRRELDRFVPTPQLAQSQNDEEPETLLAEEVKAIKFRYFDGTDWHDTWTSSEMRRLPRAVEVAIRFRPIDFQWSNLQTDQSSDGFRQVILVPLSEPGVGNTQ